MSTAFVEASKSWSVTADQTYDAIEAAMVCDITLPTKGKKQLWFVLCLGMQGEFEFEFEFYGRNGKSLGKMTRKVAIDSAGDILPVGGFDAPLPRCEWQFFHKTIEQGGGE